MTMELAASTGTLGPDFQPMWARLSMPTFPFIETVADATTPMGGVPILAKKIMVTFTKGWFHRALVPLLFAPCGPAAIARLIVAISVDAVQRHALWAWTHICEEVGKSEYASPPVTDSDPAPTISRPMTGIGIKASLDHAVIRIPGWCAFVAAQSWGSLIVHRQLLSGGVRGRAVPAAPSLSLYPVGVWRW